MSAHRFIAGRAGRCARCGCAETEVVHCGTSRAPDTRTLLERIRALSADERTWVLFWLAQDPDPGPRAVLGAALDEERRAISNETCLRKAKS